MDEQLIARVRQEVAALCPQVRALRQRLHTQPELQFREVETRKALLAFIADAGLSIRAPLLGTDLIADLPGQSATTIVLRADMDALPILEQSGVPHQSTTPGVMHACGHDGHSAMLAGAACVLSRLRAALPVSVRFIFQPAEEMVCGGEQLVAKGACDGAVAAFALHGWPGLPVGTVSTRPGPLFAAADFFAVIVQGRGGHAAMPHLAQNPITALAPLISQLTDLHRDLNAQHGAVVTVTTVHGGQASNVIPDAVTIEGTIRYLDPALGVAIADRIRAILAQVAAATGCRLELVHERKYHLPVLNTAAAAAHVRAVAAVALGETHYLAAAQPSMGAEDFAFYLRDRAGAMFWLGLGEHQPSLHNPRFDFNDDALATGMLMHCLLALGYTPATGAR